MLMQRRVRLAVALPLPALARGRARIRSATMSIAVSRSSRSHSRRVRTAVEHVPLARIAGRQLQRRRALRAQPAAAVRRVRVALDLHDLAVLDVDVLRAADRAVRADRLDHAVGVDRARAQLPRARAT